VDLMMPHPVRGYTLRPGAAGHHTAGGHRTPIHINASGFRDTPFEDAVRAQIRILSVGDSFTLGLGVDSMEPWPKQLEALLRRDLGPSASVVNAGVPGYSARQMRQMMQEVAPVLHPQVVVFGTYVRTYWRVNQPYVLFGGYLVKTADAPNLVLGRGGILYSPLERWPWLQRLDLWLNLNFELGAHLLALAQRVYDLALPGRSGPAPVSAAAPIDTAEARRRMQPVLEEISEASRVAHEGGMELVVLLINPQEPDGTFLPEEYQYDEVVQQFGLKEKIRVFDPLPVLVQAAHGQPIFRAVDDGHWTRPAHQLVAEALYGYLRREGVIGGSRVALPSSAAGPQR
jgi:lysophospholipase L1-like esterase